MAGSSITPLYAKSFSDIPFICHGFHTRKGGVSSEIYESLNVGQTHLDDPEHILENKRRIVKFWDQPFDNLYLLNQIHGKDTHIITKEKTPIFPLSKGDSMVTKEPNLILGIKTADCCPVLFVDTKNRIIAAAHAGWKGALQGIISSTVTTMESLGAERSFIKAVIGPSIYQESYEMGREIYDIFCDTSPKNAQFFLKIPSKNSFLFDLPGYVLCKLKKEQLSHDASLSYNTYSREDLFFSYRRSFHRKEPYGCQLSVIFIKKD